MIGGVFVRNGGYSGSFFMAYLSRGSIVID